jgi:hypothetical protein
MARVFHPIAQTTMVYFRYSHGTNQLENVYGYRWNNTTPPSAAELLTLCTEIGATFGPKLQQMMHDQVTLLEVHARNMDVPLGNVATAAFTPGTVGAQHGQQSPSNAAGNLVTRTGQAGYSQHGSKRYSECAADNYNGNTISNAQMSRYASLALSILAVRVGGRFLPAVPHINRTGVGSSSIILSCLMLDSNVDSQKTRLNGHGT